MIISSITCTEEERENDVAKTSVIGQKKWCGGIIGINGG